MKVEILNAIVDKAAVKKDGCYRCRGIAYRVRNGKVTHVATDGKLFQIYGGFVTQVCSYEYNLYSDEAG